jgi:glutamate/tyrosine decarboxylase-like PLP-dependent enzyme
MDLGRKSLQCGRRADALKLWCAWKAYGTDGLGAQVDRFVDLARFVARLITEQPSLELLEDAPFANVCFRVRGEDDAFQVKVRELLKDSGRALVNHARVRNQRCLRLIVANHVADETTLRTFIDDVLWACQEARDVSRSPSASPADRSFSPV